MQLDACVVEWIARSHQVSTRSACASAVRHQMHLYPVFPHCLAWELIVLNTHLNIRVLFNYQVNNIPQCRREAFPRPLPSPPRLPSPHRAWNIGQGRPRQGCGRGQPAGPPTCLTSLQGSVGEQPCVIWRPGLQFKVELCILKSCTGCLGMGAGSRACRVGSVRRASSLQGTKC